jgi:hypothetical protein
MEIIINYNVIINNYTYEQYTCVQIMYLQLVYKLCSYHFVVFGFIVALVPWASFETRMARPLLHLGGDG